MFLQAQIDEFEKRLTAVHTRGLENVESPEMDEENQKQGGPSERTVTQTPLGTKGRTRTKRGWYSEDLVVQGCPVVCNRACRKDSYCFVTRILSFVTGQSKPSVSNRGDDSFVTPQRTRKSKKPVVTFSSDEEEDEEGECDNFDNSVFHLHRHYRFCCPFKSSFCTIDLLLW